LLCISRSATTKDGQVFRWGKDTTGLNSLAVPAGLLTDVCLLRCFDFSRCATAQVGASSALKQIRHYKMLQQAY
jgi:hypothetical protein